MRRFLLTMNFISPFCRHFSSFLRMSKIVSIHRFCQNCTKDFFIQFLDFPLAACPLTHKGQKTQICENWQQKMCLVGQPHAAAKTHSFYLSPTKKRGAASRMMNGIEHDLPAIGKFPIKRSENRVVSGDCI